MSRWLLLALLVLSSGFQAGCSATSAVDPSASPTPLPTRPTLSLPTRPARGDDLPWIRSSFDVPPPGRTPYYWLTPVVGVGGEASDQATPTPDDREAAGTAQPANGSPAATATRTETATATPRPTLTRQVAHRFVVSTRARAYYYCDTDLAWKSLSPANLRWYDSEAKLKAEYPRLTLHEPCR